MPKSKKTDELEQQIADLTADLQRTRADFENYRKQIEREKQTARDAGQTSAILKLLPVIDTIDRAITHVPSELADNTWAQGITGLTKQLEKALESLDLTRIDAAPGTEFNPELHEAITTDGDGDKQVIAQELQAGYKLGDRVVRHSLVKVTVGS